VKPSGSGFLLYLQMSPLKLDVSSTQQIIPSPQSEKIFSMEVFNISMMLKNS